MGLRSFYGDGCFASDYGGIENREQTRRPINLGGTGDVGTESYPVVTQPEINEFMTMKLGSHRKGDIRYHNIVR